MGSTRVINASVIDLLASLEGEIVAAGLAYPEVLHVDVRDRSGGRWRFATQDADWTPADPSRLLGLSVLGVEIDEDDGGLRWRLSDESLLEVVPADDAVAGDPPAWELFTPDGVFLAFGPGLRWRFGRADDPVTV
jgi:hypothetical protein